MQVLVKIGRFENVLLLKKVTFLSLEAFDDNVMRKIDGVIFQVGTFQLVSDYRETNQPTCVAISPTATSDNKKEKLTIPISLIYIRRPSEQFSNGY